MVPDTAEVDRDTLANIAASVAAPPTRGHAARGTMPNEVVVTTTRAPVTTASIIDIQGTAVGTATSIMAHMAITPEASVLAGNTMATTPAPGTMVTTDMSSLIAADVGAVATNTVATPDPGTMATTDTSLLIAADVDAAVTNTVTTLDPGIMVTTGMSSPIVADVDAAVTNTVTTLDPGTMATADMGSLIVADVVEAVTNTVTTPAPGIMGTTGTSSPIAATMAISDMSRIIRAITARVLRTLAAGDEEPVAWVMRPVGVERAPEMTTTMLVQAPTRPERKAPLVLGHAVLPAPVCRLACWTTQTITKTAS